MILGLSRNILNVITKGNSKGRLCILNYHRVLNKTDPYREGDVDLETFGWHMDLLKSQFNVLRLGEAVKLLKQNKLPERAICITFDDGYSDNEKNALPVLLDLDLSATFFISTGYLDNGCMWNDVVIESIRRLKSDELDLSPINLGTYSVVTVEEKIYAVNNLIDRIKYFEQKERKECTDYIGGLVGSVPTDLMLTPIQVKNLYSSGMEIASHTVSHPILKKVSYEEAEIEISESKKVLENIINDRVSLFAYPNGYPMRDYGGEHVKLVKDIGYQAAVTTKWGVANHNSDFWQMPRFRPWNITKEKFMLNLLRNYFRLI